MTLNSPESSNELVLDNRKLIIAFLLLIIACAVFFLIGFMEGKRQGQQIRAGQSLPGQAGPAAAENRPQGEAGVADAQSADKALNNASLSSQLDWYRKVSGEEDKARASKPGSPTGSAVRKAPESMPRTEPTVSDRPAAAARPAKEPTAAAIKYSVQVGAFRQSAQAETRAAELKAKGYTCTLEPPRGANELYLVKVGVFTARADAVAMQLRLKKDGFSSFIKTSP